MEVKYKHLTLSIIIAFVLLFGATMLIDIALHKKLNFFAEGFTALMLAIPCGFVFNLVKNNWGKEKRSPKEEE